MLSISLQSRIFKDYHEGKDFTKGIKYKYSIQYHPMSLYPVWIIRSPIEKDEWDFLEPLAENL